MNYAGKGLDQQAIKESEGPFLVRREGTSAPSVGNTLDLVGR